MPLMGGNLNTLIETSPEISTNALSLTVLRQMLHALRPLEELELVHRNIKPENILWDYYDSGTYHFRLGDFGLPNEIEVTDAWGGPGPFVAPETFNKKAQSHKVDIWSLFANAVWVRNTEGFRDKCRQMSTPKIHDWLVNISKLDEYKGVGIMASRNPSKRPSARELLMRLGNDGDEAVQTDEWKIYVQEEKQHDFIEQNGAPYYEPYNLEEVYRAESLSESNWEVPRGKAKGKSIPGPNSVCGRTSLY